MLHAYLESASAGLKKVHMNEVQRMSQVKPRQATRDGVKCWNDLKTKNNAACTKESRVDICGILQVLFITHTADSMTQPQLLLVQVITLLGLGCLWFFLSTNINGPLARFLMGVFPREMATLGLSGVDGAGRRDH